MKRVRPWRVEADRSVFDHPLLNVEMQELRAGADRREALVLRSADWVNVIPLIESGEQAPAVVFIRQWRFGRAEVSLEIPGGIVEAGEDAGVAAGRELHEETGYLAGRIERLGVVEPNPAIFDNVCSLWLARDLAPTGDPIGDGSEELEVVLVPLCEVPDRIARGEIRHSLVVTAFYFFAQRYGFS